MATTAAGNPLFVKPSTLIPQFISGDFQGSVRACDLDTRETDVGTLARKVGYVYQDFENQIIRPTVLDDASYACLNYAMPDYRERGLQALEQCGLKGKQDDFIWQLSGGQTHLLALAGAVSLQPEVLILDEPIAQLDPKHADQIYAVLRELNENYGKTIIVIEHHTEYIADFCKHVMLMKDGMVQWYCLQAKPPAGGGTARLQYLSSQADHCSPSDANKPEVSPEPLRFRSQWKKESDLCSKSPSRRGESRFPIPKRRNGRRIPECVCFLSERQG